MPKGIPKNGINRGWIKRGTKLSQETIEKIRKNSAKFWLGKKLPTHVVELMKLRKPTLGKHMSEETKHKIANSRIGDKNWAKRPEVRKKMSEAKKGKPPHNKGKKSKLFGEKHWNWQGGINPINDTIRNSLEYKLWRESVFKRDNYTCVWCGQRGGKINADHIKPFALYPQLRFAIDNGRTLCVPCHRKTDTWGGKKKKSDD